MVVMVLVVCGSDGGVAVVVGGGVSVSVSVK